MELLVIEHCESESSQQPSARAHSHNAQYYTDSSQTSAARTQYRRYRLFSVRVRYAGYCLPVRVRYAGYCLMSTRAQYRHYHLFSVRVRYTG